MPYRVLGPLGRRAEGDTFVEAGALPVSMDFAPLDDGNVWRWK